MRTAKLIQKAFRELRKAGFFAKSNHTCCQTCGVAEVPENKEQAYVFYHQQSAEDLRYTNECCLSFGSTAEHGLIIVRFLEEAGLTVDWNGSVYQTIRVTVRPEAQS